MKGKVLIVEDEEKLRRVMELHLRSSGFDVEQAAAAEEGLRLAEYADLVITDLRLPGMDGLALMDSIRRQNSQIPVVVVTAFGTVEKAVEAMKAGAADFLLKPFSLDHLTAVVEKALEVSALRHENQNLKAQLHRKYQFENLVGQSRAMQDIFATIERVAPTRATVLLAGESGVGKDLIARAIHHHSPRADKPFVKIDCTALPENLIESELFGFEKGAFTGAAAGRAGKFEQADQGTVFLDEIGDVPTGVQVKLLRVLQDREFERLGSNKVRKIDVRIVAATNQDLRVALENGTFREDLYYRLNVVPIDIPPLRQRKEDIPLLAGAFIASYAQENGMSQPRLTSAALERLLSHGWPGNVRELENVIQRSLILCREGGMDAADIRLDAPMRASPHLDSNHLLPDGMSLDTYEQAIIREALARSQGNKSQAARLLGITRNAFRYRLAQMGIDPK